MLQNKLLTDKIINARYTVIPLNLNIVLYEIFDKENLELAVYEK